MTIWLFWDSSIRGAVGDGVKIALSLLASPVDELLARLSLPNAYPEGPESDHIDGYADEAALGTGHEPMTE
jgi:hypothetical protein